jgi:hypothetical protein
MSRADEFDTKISGVTGAPIHAGRSLDVEQSRAMRRVAGRARSVHVRRVEMRTGVTIRHSRGYYSRNIKQGSRAPIDVVSRTVGTYLAQCYATVTHVLERDSRPPRFTAEHPP